MNTVQRIAKNTGVLKHVRNRKSKPAKKLFCKQKHLLKNAYAIAKGTGIIFIGSIAAFSEVCRRERGKGNAEV